MFFSDEVRKGKEFHLVFFFHKVGTFRRYGLPIVIASFYFIARLNLFRLPGIVEMWIMLAGFKWVVFELCSWNFIESQVIVK